MTVTRLGCTEEFLRLLSESQIAKHSPKQTYLPKSYPLNASLYSHSPLTTLDPTRKPFYDTKHVLPEKWAGSKIEATRIKQIDTPWQMPDISPTRRNIYKHEAQQDILNRIRSYLQAKSHPIYGPDLPEMVLRGKVLESIKGYPFLFRIEVEGGLVGVAEGNGEAMETQQSGLFVPRSMLETRAMGRFVRFHPHQPRQ